MPVRKHGQRWQIRCQINGKRYEATLPRGASKADAVAYEAKVRREEINSLVGRPERKTIGDLLDVYEQQAKRLKSYERDLRYRIAVLKARFGTRDAADAAEVGRALAGNGKLSVAATNRYLAILRRSCRLAGIGANISMVAGETRRGVYLTREEVNKLADAAGQWGD